MGSGNWTWDANMPKSYFSVALSALSVPRYLHKKIKNSINVMRNFGVFKKNRSPSSIL
jgi:hypothetical protein